MKEGAAKERSNKRRRTKVLFLRLLPTEHAHLSKSALAVPMNKGDYVRALIMGKSVRPKRIHPQRFYRAFNGVANNFNQLVRKINSNDIPTTAEIESFKHLVEHCIRTLTEADMR